VPAPVTSPLIGRGPEVDELAGWLSAADGGRGRLVVLHGPAGVGKTRLVEELAGHAEALGVPTVWGRCPSAAGAPPLWPLRRVVEQAGLEWPTAPESAGGRADVAAASRFALFVAVADRLIARSGTDGLLLLLEDLHWADSATLGALRHLTGELGRSRLLVVATTRHSAADERTGVPGEHRHLAGFDVATTGEYLAGLAGEPVGAAYADFVHERTAGNPLYVAAVSRLLAARVSWDRFDRAAATQALATRPEFADLVRDPLDRLSAAARAVVEAASLAGEEFSNRVVGMACGVPLVTVRTALDEAVAAGLLRPAESPDRGRFLHALVRDGVAEQLTPAHRRRVHRQIAAALMTPPPGRARRTELAHHLSRAASTPVEHRVAADALADRGAQSAAQFAYAEAAGQYAAALDHLDLVPDVAAAERAELLLARARADFAAGAFGAALDACVDAGELAGASGRWDLLGEAALVVDGVVVDGPERIADLVERALAAVPKPASQLRAQLLARQAYDAASRGRLDDARELSAAAVTLAQRTGDPAAILACLRARHLAVAGPDYSDERSRLGHQAVGLAARGLPVGAMWGRIWRVDSAFELGGLAAVDSELLALKTVADSLHYPLAQWHLLRLRAAREALVGRFAAGEQHAAAALELADALQDPSLRTLHWAFLYSVAHVRWATDTAQGFPLPAEQIIDFLISTPGMPPVGRASLVGLYLLLERRDEAHEVLRQMVAQVEGYPVDGAWIVTVELLADGAAHLGDVEAAAVLYPLFAPYGHLMIAGGTGALACVGSASRTLGRLALLLGRPEIAEVHLRDALRFEDRMGARPFAAMSRLHLAEVLLARGGTGRLTEAAGLARTALETMRALDMPGRAAVAEGIAAAINAALADRTAFTAREREVVALVAEGMSNLQIAQRLYLSERTVETHVSHVLAKLGGSTRVDIVTWAMSTGTA